MSDKEILMKIKLFTIICSITLSLLSMLLFDFNYIGIGIILGSLCGIWSLQMISKTINNLDFNNANNKLFIAYLFRMSCIVVVFIIATLKGVSLIALVFGFIINKLTISIVNLKFREEDDGCQISME